MKWWESKRLAYNILVLIFIGIATIVSVKDNYIWDFTDFLSFTVWLIGANIFFSLGTFTELLDWFYFENKIKIYKYKLFLFTFGTFFSCLWTFIYYCLYFIDDF